MVYGIQRIAKLEKDNSDSGVDVKPLFMNSGGPVFSLKREASAPPKL